MGSGDLGFRRVDRQERGASLATTIRLKARGQVVQDVAALLPTGRHDGQHPLHEPTPVQTVGPTADSPPDDRMPQRPLHCVVRRLNPFDACECPQTLLDLEDLEAGRRSSRARTPRPILQGLLDLPTQTAHPLLEPNPSQGPISYSVPVAEQPVRQREQTPPGRRTVATPVDHRLEIATQMRPADLPPRGHDPLIRAESITADHLAIFAAQEGFGDRAAPFLGDSKDREPTGHRRPQPGLAAVLTPRGLVDVCHLGSMDGSREFVVRSLQSRSRLPFQLGDHPGGDREGEQITGQLLDLSLAEAVGPREHGQHGLEVGAEASRRDTQGQAAARRLAAVGARQAMEPILVDDRLDLGQFGDLMDEGFGIVTGEMVTTTTTGSRLAVDGLANLLRRDQTAVGFAMSGLSSTLLPARRGGGSALHSDRIGGGRLGRVRGVELEPALKIVDPVLQLSDASLVELNESENRRLMFRRRCSP